MIPPTLKLTTSPAQRERLDKLEELHPGTHFDIVFWCRWSCALEVEWSDGGGSGDFILTANGHIFGGRE